MSDQSPNPDPPFDAEPEAPEALVRELARAHLPPTPIEVPPEADERVAAMARWRLSQRATVSATRQHGASIFGRPKSPRRLPFPPAVSIAAAAAALLLIVLLVPRFFGPVPVKGPAPTGLAKAPPSPADIDGNGRIDILDAFALARSVRDRQQRAMAAEGAAGRAATVNLRWDINGDGVVDEADADAIAKTAVRLAPSVSPGGAG